MLPIALPCIAQYWSVLTLCGTQHWSNELSLWRFHNIGLFDLLPDWGDGRVSRRSAQNLVYSISETQKLQIMSVDENLTGWRATFDIIGSVWWKKVTMTTRSAVRGEMKSVYAASHVYHGSFLPRTIRNTRGNAEIVWKQNTLTSTTNQQQIAVTLGLTKITHC